MDASLVIQTSRFVLTANHTISDLPPPSPSDEKRKPTTTLTVVVVKKSMLRRMKEKLGPTRAKLQTQDKNVLDNNGHLYGDISSSDLSGEAGVTYLNLPQLKVGVVSKEKAGAT